MKLTRPLSGCKESLCLLGGLMLMFLCGFIEGCGDLTEETRQAAVIRRLEKEKADLKEELLLRRAPETDQVAVFERERMDHEAKVASLKVSLEEAERRAINGQVDPALSPLQGTLRQLRGEIGDMRQEIQAMRHSMEACNGSDTCHCGVR